MNRTAMFFCVALLTIPASRTIAADACHDGDNQLHLHIGHLMWCWTDTPDGAGLLATAEAEAEVALRHAELAIADDNDLAAIQAHIGHVIHAIDPTLVPEGPGLGYGLILAAEGAAVHIGFAMESDNAFATDDVVARDVEYDDAIDQALAEFFDNRETVPRSEFIQSQASIAGQSLSNATQWANEALAIAQSTLAETSIDQATENAHSIASLLGATIGGQDTDGDGKISFRSGEGGLGHAHAAMAILMAVEGVAAPATPEQ